jgi:hypothetical protein
MAVSGVVLPLGGFFRAICWLEGLVGGAAWQPHQQRWVSAAWRRGLGGGCVHGRGAIGIVVTLMGRTSGKVNELISLLKMGRRKTPVTAFGVCTYMIVRLLDNSVLQASRSVALGGLWL